MAGGPLAGVGFALSVPVAIRTRIGGFIKIKKVRMLLFIALAVVLAYGICGQPALAQDLAEDADVSVVSIGHITDASPDATSPGMYQGIVAMGPNPTVAGDWPCFGPTTDCAGIVKGGLVIGEPEQLWTKSCSACGQIFYTFQTTTATGTANIVVTVTQGTPATTIFRYSGALSGTIAKNSVVAVGVGPVTFTGGVAGAATINVATTIGTATIKSGAKITLH